MGCFSKPETPTIRTPERVVLPTAGELFTEGKQQAQDISPLAYGARESALANIGQMTPEEGFFEGFQPQGYGEISPDYYEQFGPTSFEEALGNQYFQNVWPDTQKEIKHALSLSGMESSPILAQQLGQARGDIGYDIGSFLANMGQQRATQGIARQEQMAQRGQRQGELTLAGRQQGLLSQLGIDPMDLVRGYVDPAMTRTGQQGEIDWSRNQTKAQADYLNELAEFEREMSFAKQMGFLAGPIGGWAYGGPEAGIGSIQDAFSMIGFGEGYQPYSPNMGGGGISQFGNTYGSNTPYGAQDRGTYSTKPPAQSGLDFSEMLGKAGQAAKVFM